MYLCGLGGFPAGPAAGFTLSIVGGGDCDACAALFRGALEDTRYDELLRA